MNPYPNGYGLDQNIHLDIRISESESVSGSEFDSVMSRYYSVSLCLVIIQINMVIIQVNMVTMQINMVTIQINIVIIHLSYFTYKSVHFHIKSARFHHSSPASKNFTLKKLQIPNPTSFQGN